MIRRMIRVPRSQFRETLGQRTLSDRGQVADLLGCALRRHGCDPITNGPARWGFGVIAHPLKVAGPGRRYGIEAIHLGSSDPVIARAIAALTPADLVLDDAMPFDAAEMMRRLAERKIGTRPFFWPMHEQPVFLKRGMFGGERYPVAERLARRGFYVPSGMAPSAEQIDYVATMLPEVLL